MLQTKGFSTSYTPTDMDRFAGIHGEGTRETWLKSDHEEFKGIYLKISSSERDIGISTKWEHNGFFRGADETYRRALNLSLVLARWLELRPERDDSLPNVSNSGIRFIEEELSKLPE